MLKMEDCTMMVPFYYDCEERFENLKLSLRCLSHNAKTRVIIGEQHGTKIADELENLRAIAPNLSISSCSIAPVKFAETEHQLFYLTKLINRIASLVETPFLAFYGCDSLLAKHQIKDAIELLRLGVVKCVYPYDTPTYDIPKEFHYMVERLQFDVQKLRPYAVRQYLANKVMWGNAVFYDSDVFRASGGYNTEFKSWGSEDNEIFHRFTNLGIPMARVTGPIYHLEHPRGMNSGDENPFRQNNKRLELEVLGMSKQQTMDLVKKLRQNNKSTMDLVKVETKQQINGGAE